ncbi:hypothetical protein BBC0244_011050 [Bartonella apihabitans]|uniref:LEM-3-like GIY-YIG domain-containing protein n=1 Tax=Bartonella apihabitans TaxID=2750929 RepID=UPI0009C31358|nr:hypothetical protein [Bartonella apihabitans]AQT44812.1 hypothetical protein BBC0244_011050 [Bartonella apihabitans]
MMADNLQFLPEICEKLSYYVYRLIDPRNNETFYVGKGIGNRVFQHIAGHAAHDGTTLMSMKIERIDDIKKSGNQVLHIIHRHGLNEKEAFEVEAALIDAFKAIGKLDTSDSPLTNIQGGHHSAERGPMDYQDIVTLYGLPSITPKDFQHKLLLIKINKLTNRRDKDEVFRLVRYCWRINKNRAENADYVLAIYLGAVVGVFKAEKWLSAIPKNFPDVPYCDGSEKHRFGFIGKEAPDEIKEHYMGGFGKRLSDYTAISSQSPILYYDC